MATLKQLSENTGFSPATISRILNADPTLSVTEETRRKVLEEAGRINYIATRTRHGKGAKDVLRIGIAEMLSPVQQLEDLYYMYLGSYIRQGCMDKQYFHIPLEQIGGSFIYREKEPLNGIVAIGEFTVQQIESLSSISSNIVFVDSSPYENLYDSVNLSYESGIALAMEKLFELGHTRIAYVGPTMSRDTFCMEITDIRKKAYEAIMSEKGLSYGDLLIETPMSMNEAQKRLKSFISNSKLLPTALLCANEEIAVGSLMAVKECNLSVPDDISIVSFNDTPKSTLVTPALTSITTHVDEMSSIALRLLAERASLHGKAPTRSLPLKVTVPLSLTVRDSTGTVKK